MLIGYARVSSDEQNPDLQHDALRADGCEKIFTDYESGAVDTRPELAACLHALETGDVLVVWKLDRLGRSMLHLLTTVADLQARKIGFRSLTETLDTTTPVGELLFHMLSALAHFERRMIKQRVIAGIRAAQSRGVHCGRPRTVDPVRVASVLAAQAAGRLTMVGAASEVGLSVRRLYELKAEALQSAPPPGVA